MATLESARWRDLVAARSELSKAFIDGGYVDAASGETLPCVSPVSGETLSHIAACGEDDVDRAVTAARRAFEDGRWSELPPRARKRRLLAFAQQLVDYRDELAALMTIDMGKPIASSEWEVGYSAECLQWFAEAIDHMYGEVAPLGPKALGTITREPVGVVAAITPWNYPLLMPAWKIGPALGAGNSIVLKPAEQTPLVATRLGELAASAGIPDGVFNVVPGLGETAGQALARHLDVDAVTFTGSTAVGRLIMGYAAQSNLKKVSLELGGKSPNVVLADADLAAAAHRAAFGIFQNTGQVCSAGSRLLVHASVADEVVENVVRAASEWQPGDPFDPATTQGSMVDETQMQRVLSYIETGRSEGVDVALGGHRVLEDTGGFYVEPTVFRNVNNNMRIAREEIFGPVLSVISFDDEEAAVKIANDTSYGLVAAVWTNDVTTAHRIARRIRAGSVWVNGYEEGDITLPHGGFKQSGFGRDTSLHAFDNYTQQKVTVINLSD
jgi:4-guanidinobutyraldehyde dehydrogenase/NAD-dependent aldehyde dehydrogenase